MKVLVLGSNGFIGTHFVRMFSDKYEIISESYDGNQQCHDFTVHDTALDILNNCKPEAVLNLAGKSYHTAKSDADIYESNVLVQLNLHEAAARLHLHPRIVFCSSSAVYKSSKDSVDEGSPCLPMNTYARAKYVQERVGLSYHPEHHVVIARLFNVIGPHQSKDFFVPAVIERFMRYKKRETTSVPLKTLNAMRDFILVDDVCSALDALIERGMSGEIYNVCGGKGISIQEVIDLLKELLEISDVALDIEEDFVKEGINYQVGSNQKMLEMGWTPSYDMRESLERILEEEYGR